MGCWLHCWQLQGYLPDGTSVEYCHVCGEHRYLKIWHGTSTSTSIPVTPA